MAEPSYPIELEAPEIASYRAGNTGIDYATTLDSGQPGPHVMLSAVVHSNELCGAVALDFLFRENVRPVHGKLTLVFVNVAAYHSFDPANPTASRFVDEDFNRLWSAEVLEGSRDSVELRRARELRPLVDTVDVLLDIHSMQYLSAPLLMAGPLPKGRELASGVGAPAIVVTDDGHTAGRRLRDYQGFADPGSPKNAVLVECGQHWEKNSGETAIESALRFLCHLEAIDPDFASRHLTERTLPPQIFIEITAPVTIATDEFRFEGDYRGLEVIPDAGTVIGYDGETPVATPYDDCVLIMPSRRLDKGATAVRLGRFVV